MYNKYVRDNTAQKSSVQGEQKSEIIFPVFTKELNICYKNNFIWDIGAQNSNAK